jgi:hypothetical protein
MKLKRRAARSVWRTYLERGTAFCGSTPVRVFLTLPILFVASQAVFAQCMTLASRAQAQQVLEQMGARTPGDDYRRFIPLMELMPAWYLVAGFVAGILILAAAVQLPLGVGFLCCWSRN